MKLRKIPVTILVLLILFLGCKKNDDLTFIAVPDRDRTEVYEENLADIEEFLRTHFYNYEDFDFTDPNNPQNDTFEIEFTPLSEDPTKISLMDMETNNDFGSLEFKMVEGVDEISYKLYYLKVREGSGDMLHPADEAFLSYKGTTVKNDEGDVFEGDVFDSAVTPEKLNLTFVSDAIPGVIEGFREGMIEFKTSTGFTENGDGTQTYHNFGIGTLFIPSGIAYFSAAVGGIESYDSLMFKIGLVDRADTDFDLDNVPSYLEDLDEDGNVYTEDTDSDFVANFIDNDDDGDGVLTRDEDLEPDTNLEEDTDGDGDPTNDIGDGDPTNDDTDEDGIPNYLDIDDNGSRQDDADGDGIPDYTDDN